METTSRTKAIRWTFTPLLLVSTTYMGSQNTKLVSPQFHVVLFDNNLKTVQPTNQEPKADNTMDRLFKTNNYKYDDPFGFRE
jgi:hypothetical protein